MSAHLRLMALVNGNMGTIRAIVEAGQTAVVVCDAVGDTKRLAKYIGGTGKDQVFALTEEAARPIMMELPAFAAWLGDTTRERVILFRHEGTVAMEFGPQGLMPVDINTRLN